MVESNSRRTTGARGMNKRLLASAGCSSEEGSDSRHDELLPSEALTSSRLRSFPLHRHILLRRQTFEIFLRRQGGLGGLHLSEFPHYFSETSCIRGRCCLRCRRWRASNLVRRCWWWFPRWWCWANCVWSSTIIVRHSKGDSQNQLYPLSHAQVPLSFTIY